MIVLNTGSSGHVLALAFHPDGKHLLGGYNGGIQRWQLTDGQEVGKQTGMQLRAISVSRDRKWIVCGTFDGASVWDGELRKKAIDVEGKNGVWAVDVSPDSIRFATGTHRQKVTIWNIETGERLVGPLNHDNPGSGSIAAIRFSPRGEQIATACFGGESIRIFDSHNGSELIAIKTTTPTGAFSANAITLLTWSSDGQQIFAASKGNKIRCFNVSTGLQLAESLQILPNHNNADDVYSIALAANGKFIATFADRSISLLDVSTLARICPIIEGDERIWSIAISTDSRYLAAGRFDGKTIVYHLDKILPDSYGPFHVGIYSSIIGVSQTSLLLLRMLTN